MKLSVFWLALHEICSNTTKFNETHKNKRKFGEIRRNSIKYILHKRVLIGAQGKILRKFSFFHRIYLCSLLLLLTIKQNVPHERGACL